jgi:hypothetical protein
VDRAVLRVEQLDELVAAVAGAGATSVLFTPLYLATGVKDVFLTWLRSEHPGLVDDYTQLYSTGSETPSRYREWLGGRIRSLFAKHGLPDPDASTEDRFALNGRRYAADDPAQLSLF